MSLQYRSPAIIYQGDNIVVNLHNGNSIKDAIE